MINIEDNDENNDIINTEDNTEDNIELKKRGRKKKDSASFTSSTSRIETNSKLSNDDLMEKVAEELNKKDKSLGKVFYSLDDEDSPSQISGWIPTNIVDLDLAIANIPNGGFPLGRVVEIYGDSTSGKSLLAAHLIAQVQKIGGIGLLVDTENAIFEDFLRAIGVKKDGFKHVPADTVEFAFEKIEDFITKAREKNNNKPILIVLDSLAGATTNIEKTDNFDKKGYDTTKALLISKAMRKITNLIGKQKICLVITNQVRVNLNAMFGDKMTTSGGKAVGFHASVRIKLNYLGPITKTINGKKHVIGVRTKAKIEKNRLGPPKKEAFFDIYYDRGIDIYSNWIRILDENNIISPLKKDDLKYLSDQTIEIKEETEFKLTTGPGSLKGNDKEVSKVTKKAKVSKFIDSNGVYHIIDKNLPILLKNNPTLKAELYKKMCDSLISVYKTPDDIIDDDVEHEISESENEDD